MFSSLPLLIGRSGSRELYWLTAVCMLIFTNICHASLIPGVPVPPIDPMLPAPEPPAAWSNSAVDNFYYVDNTSPAATDADNPFGFPGRPRLTIPTGSFPAGTYIEVHGGPYDQGTRISVSGNGTEQNPVWLRGNANQTATVRTRLSIGGSYVIVENLRFDQSRKTLGVVAGSSNILIRNNVLAGPGINDGNTAAIAISGSESAPTRNLILYGNSVTGFGDKNPNAAENDYHGIKGARYCSGIWILNNQIYGMSGDSVQFGEATLPDNERCSGIYIAENTFHDNRENAVDIKNSENIFIVGNRMSDFAPSGSSSGTALVVHNGADNVWIIGNTISNSSIGIANTGGTNVWVIANLIARMNSFGNAIDPGSYYGSGVAVHFRGESSGGVVNNTFFENEKGVQISGGGSYEISGNIFADRLIADSYDVMVRTTALSSVTAIVDNLHSDFAIRVSSTEFRSPNDFSFAYPSNTGAIEADPLFAGPSNGDFRLLDTSPAAAAGVESQAYSEFRSRYGLPITFDLAKQSRPVTGAWDLGAMQAPQGPIPDSPGDLN